MKFHCQTNDFDTAIYKWRSGYKVRAAHWPEGFFLKDWINSYNLAIAYNDKISRHISVNTKGAIWDVYYDNSHLLRGDKKTMKFEEAIKLMREGKKIEHSEWTNNKAWLTIKDGKIVNQDGGVGIFLDGWKLYEEPGMTFDEALVKLKRGHTMRRKSWDDWAYIIWKPSCGGLLGGCRGHECLLDSLDVSSILANDWEVVE